MSMSLIEALFLFIEALFAEKEQTINSLLFTIAAAMCCLIMVMLDTVQNLFAF